MNATQANKSKTQGPGKVAGTLRFFLAGEQAPPHRPRHAASPSPAPDGRRAPMARGAIRNIIRYDPTTLTGSWSKTWRRAAALLAIGGAAIVGACAEEPPVARRDEIAATPVEQSSERAKPADKAAPTEPGPLPAIEVDAAKAALGKLLFFDKKISGDATLSCATCHIPEKGWTDGGKLSPAYPGSKYFRSAKTVLNAVHARYFHWDARLSAKDVPTMVRDQITETHFLNMDGRLMLERLKQVPEYDKMFRESMGGEPSFGRTLKAIAEFLKTLVSQDVPFDKGTMSADAKAGYALFKGKAGCIKCHSGVMFSDNQAHALGVPDNPEILGDPMRAFTMRSFNKFMGVDNWENEKSDVGYYIVSKLEADKGKFLTPTLREVSRTAPYMHNGMLATLEDVIEFYNKGGGKAANKAKALEPLGLSDDDKKQLLAFLNALSGKEIIVKEPEIPDYQAIEDWRNKDN